MLTFQELISVSMFSKATILGGWSGKERNFANVDDSITDNHNSALLLLPVGKENLIRLSEYLANPTVQGIVLYGAEKIHLSTSLSEEIAMQQKPVLYVNETNVQYIKKTIMDMAQLKTLGHFQYVWEGMTDYWLSLMHQQSLEEMIARLRLFVHENLILLKSDFTLYYKDGESKFYHELKDIRHLYYKQIKKKEGWSVLHKDGHHYLLFPIRLEDHTFGFLLLEEQPGMMIDTCIEIVTHAIPALVAYLKKEQAVLQTHQLYKDNFLYNLLYNNIESEHVLFELGKQWGWDFTRPAQLMVLRLLPENDYSPQNYDTDAIMGTVRSTIASSFLSSITHQLQGNIVIIVFDTFERSGKERKEFMLALANQIRSGIEKMNLNVICKIGLGRPYPTNMKLYKSFYEAKVALELGRSEIHQRDVLHFEDIGIARLLSNIQNDLLHEYYIEVLDELLQQEQRDDYIATLQEFFRNNGDISKTAEQLFVHPNTLRKRIKKIESILDCDLNQIEDQLKILVGLKIMKMLL